MTTLLACLDASPYANGVCDYAVWASGRLSASVELLHVLDHREIDPVPQDLSGVLGLGERDSLLEEYVAVEEQRHRLARRRGQVLLDAAAERVRAAGVAEVTAHQRHGTLVDAVAELASSVDLIVIGKRGESAAHAGADLGSNLERLARAVHTPILVVPPQFRPVERVLLAYDGGSAARKAVERIATLPLLPGTRYRLLLVGADDDRHRAQLDDATKLLADAGILVSAEVAPGDPERVIVAQIEAFRADLLVMGAYGHSRIRELFIGSTTTALLRSAPVPVLMYR